MTLCDENVPTSFAPADTIVRTLPWQASGGRPRSVRGVAADSSVR
jgi:hypothetical protein